MPRMSITGLVFIFLFGYSLGIPTGELSKILDLNNDDRYPEVLGDPLELSNLLVQWNKEGKIYLLNGDNSYSYSSASRICQKYNMELVRIESEEKSRIINSLLETYTRDGDGPFWMSGSRLKDGKTWRWMDDQPITYFNWAKLEPNNAKLDEMCIELYRDRAAWNDERCSIKNAFICENIPKGDSGFVSILDSNDILDDIDDKVVNQPSAVFMGDTVSPTERHTGLSFFDPVSSTETNTELDDYSDFFGTVDYGFDDTLNKTEEITTEHTETENSTSTTTSQPRHPSIGVPAFIPPVDDYEYGDYSEADIDTGLNEPTIRHEVYESLMPKYKPKVTYHDYESDKENYYHDYYNPDRIENYDRGYDGKEW